MIRYAITGGTLEPFLKRDREACASRSGPTLLDDSSSAHESDPPTASLLDQVRQLAREGVDYIQLREKHLLAGELATLARQMLLTLNQIASENGRQTRLLINTRLDVAASTAACGVHLPQTPGSLIPSQVRLIYQSIDLPGPTVSVSCHTLPAVRAALRHQPDLILFSPVFGKSIRNVLVSHPAGLKTLAAACALAHPIPVLALGGVTPADIPSCLQAGAAGVAGIRFFQR